MTRVANPYLDAVIAHFVAKPKRERIAALAAKPARRGDLRDALLHDTRSLDRATLIPLAAADANVAGVMRRLRANSGAAPAYCISALVELDDRELAIADALPLVIGRADDALVYCIATGTAYYENHEGEQYILAQPGVS